MVGDAKIDSGDLADEFNREVLTLGCGEEVYFEFIV
jgi:hypothetical protein